MDLIAIHGGNKHTPRIAQRGGWYYGAQHGDTLYAPPYMLDFDPIDQSESAWERYLAAVKSHRPHLALILDFDQRDQFDMMLDRVWQIAELGVIPVVAVKCDAAIQLTPQFVKFRDGRIVEVRWALSVPSEYPSGMAWYLPRHEQIKRIPTPNVHLLGGHPDQWLWLKSYYGERLNIASADGNIAFRKGRWGQWWSAEQARWIDERGNGRDTHEMIIATMSNATRYLQSPHSRVRESERIKRLRRALYPASQSKLFDVA
jgi:hypothetical protein